MHSPPLLDVRVLRLRVSLSPLPRVERVLEPQDVRAQASLRPWHIMIHKHRERTDLYKPNSPPLLPPTFHQATIASPSLIFQVYSRIYQATRSSATAALQLAVLVIISISHCVYLQIKLVQANLGTGLRSVQGIIKQGKCRINLP